MERKPTALITGATGGIGQAVARRLAAHGYGLQLQYMNRREAALELQQELSALYNVPVDIYQAELSSWAGVKELIRALPVSPLVLVHNAGTAQYNLLGQISDEEYTQLTGLHLTAPFLLTRELVPAMVRERWGRVIFISSVFGERGAACESVYSMVKGGQNAFMKAVAKEVGSSGVTVNAVSPGAVDTDMISGFTDEEKESIQADIPVGRLAESRDVAHAVKFLVDPESAYITGHILRVDGGWYM
jgi:3-oxoacyl-[acyl-carrier protein] reductase